MYFFPTLVILALQWHWQLAMAVSSVVGAVAAEAVLLKAMQKHAIKVHCLLANLPYLVLLCFVFIVVQRKKCQR